MLFYIQTAKTRDIDFRHYFLLKINQQQFKQIYYVL